MSGQSSLFDTGASADVSFDTIKSWRSFEQYFSDATSVRAITFCDSPDLLLEFFEEYDLDRLEVIVGDVTDYRERLEEENQELVDRLEQLKEGDDLLIYTCPGKQVHSKMYVIQYEEGPPCLMTGSANLTRNGWRNQTNHMAIVRAPASSDVHEQFLSDFEQHKDDYAERFLDDLTELIDTSDEDREEVIRYWVQGRETSRNEYQELNLKAIRQMKEQGTGSDIVLSLRGFSDDLQETVRDRFQDYGGSTGGDSTRIDPGGYSRFMKKTFGIPTMWIDGEGVFFVPPGGPQKRVDDPPDDRGELADALDNLDAYFHTVDRFGETNRPESVKSHMFEALLYFFWVPFINRQATFYRDNHIQNLDKSLPFLYIYGESNSGKGTFVRYALSLLSENNVRSPVDADEVTQKNIRGARNSGSCFPLVIDDIDKNKINRLEPLKNYWSGWDHQQQYPGLVFISNDRKPNAWFRNRSKILHFDNMFRSTKQGEAEVNRAIQAQNPLYRWIAASLQDKFENEQVELEDDLLRPVRDTVRTLYEAVDRNPPSYFPDQPAEDTHDVGRVRWQRLHESGGFTPNRRDGNLVLSFNEHLEHWEVSEFRRHLPGEVRVDQEGLDLIVKNPGRFHEWLGETPDQDESWLNRLFDLWE